MLGKVIEYGLLPSRSAVAESRWKTNTSTSGDGEGRIIQTPRLKCVPSRAPTASRRTSGRRWMMPPSAADATATASRKGDASSMRRKPVALAASHQRDELSRYRENQRWWGDPFQRR